MKRTDNSSDNYLLQRLAYLRTTMDDLKSLQTFGSSNFAIHGLFAPYPTGTTTPPVDYAMTLDPNTLHCFEVTLTLNSPKANPQIALVSNFYITGTNYNSYIPIIPKPAALGIQKWHIWVQNPFGTPGTLNVSVAWLSISAATWTLTRIV